MTISNTRDQTSYANHYIMHSKMYISIKKSKRYQLEKIRKKNIKPCKLGLEVVVTSIRCTLGEYVQLD